MNYFRSAFFKVLDPVRTFFLHFILVLLLVILYMPFAAAHGATEKSRNDYLEKVKFYARAMVIEGRDVYGPVYSPLFAAALNRQTLRLGSAAEFGAVTGVRENDRSLAGANPLHDTGLYEVLYHLAEVTGDKVWADEADKTLKYFFDHCQSPATGFMAWGEHLYWDFFTESYGHAGPKTDYHEAGYWPFWERCYQLSPVACFEFALGEWDHQIADKATGDFSRHARYPVHGPQTGSDFPRYAGQMIERWAYAWSRGEFADDPRRDDLLTAINVIARRMEDNMKESQAGYLIAHTGADYVWPTSNTELARALTVAASFLNDDLPERLLSLAIKQDVNFLKAPHEIKDGGGFAVTLHAHTGLPRDRSMNKPYTAAWDTGYGYGTHAGTANNIFRRYEQLKGTHPGLVDQYKELILAAGNSYLVSQPDLSTVLKPDAFAGVITLLLNCYTLTNEARYLERADFFGQMALSLFFDDKNPLPKATSHHKHYEAITGGADLMAALLNLAVSLEP